MTKAYIWRMLRDNRSVEQAVLHCRDKGTLIQSSLAFSINLVHLLLFPRAIFASAPNRVCRIYSKLDWIVLNQEGVPRSLFNIGNPAFSNWTEPFSILYRCLLWALLGRGSSLIMFIICEICAKIVKNVDSTRFSKQKINQHWLTV